MIKHGIIPENIMRGENSSVAEVALLNILNNLKGEASK